MARLYVGYICLGRDIGCAFLGRMKSDDPVCNTTTLWNENIIGNFANRAAIVAKSPNMAERPEDGEKRGESGWTLFYATPVLSESDQKFRVRERKIERERELKAGGVNYCLTAVKNNDSWNQVNLPLETSNVAGRKAKMRMVSLRPWVVVFRCWCFLLWNCNALMTVSFFFFRNITREYFAKESSGIIVHENLSWKIHGGIFCVENWISDGSNFCKVSRNLKMWDIFFDGIVMTFYFFFFSKHYTEIFCKVE